MSTQPASDRDSSKRAPQTPGGSRDGTRPTRTPLTPARIGESIGEDADPEQDIAPNLGGEEQMQDA
jgi:hypothetical protein